jgi:hypothetical protein
MKLIEGFTSIPLWYDLYGQIAFLIDNNQMGNILTTSNEGLIAMPYYNGVVKLNRQICLSAMYMANTAQSCS